MQYLKFLYIFFVIACKTFTKITSIDTVTNSNRNLSHLAHCTIHLFSPNLLKRATGEELVALGLKQSKAQWRRQAPLSDEGRELCLAPLYVIAQHSERVGTRRDTAASFSCTAKVVGVRRDKNYRMVNWDTRCQWHRRNLHTMFHSMGQICP